MNKYERLPIDSQLLHTFVKIAECGNLTLAAEQLGRTQSAISVQLRKLENNLCVSLFTRSAKGMVLTPAGETLIVRAKTILADIHSTTQLFQEPLNGSIRVALPDDFDENILERILMEFSNAHPGVKVVAKSGCTSGYADAIRAGEFDVAVCSGLDVSNGSPLDNEAIVWATRNASAWSTDEIVPLAVLDRQCYWRDLPQNLLDAVGRKHTISFQSSSFTSLQAALRAGLVIGLLPKSCVDDSLQILTETEGFPKPPVSRRSILLSSHAPDQITEAMVKAIRNVCLG